MEEQKPKTSTSSSSSTASNTNGQPRLATVFHRLRTGDGCEVETRRLIPQMIMSLQGRGVSILGSWFGRLVGGLGVEMELELKG